MENSGGVEKMFYFTRRIRPSYPRYSYVTETPLFQQVSNQIRIFLQHILRNFILVKFIRYVERGKTLYPLFVIAWPDKKKNKRKNINLSMKE